VTGRHFTYNQAPDTGECRNPAHHGWEVIGWDNEGRVGDCEVMAVCRDFMTARLLAGALNAQQVPGQLAFEVRL